MAQSSSFSVNLGLMDQNSFERSWEAIGAGGFGFGHVYKARHRQSGRDVAIKILCMDDGSSRDGDFVRHARLILRTESPYVMSPMGVYRGSKPTSPIIYLGLVMEPMDGGSLFSMQKKLKNLLPWPLVFRLAHQVALGMDYLHSLTPALIHKDLKPENTLLDSDLNVKIVDAGLAKYILSVTHGEAIQMFRTPFYMAPRALSRSATCADDVYSYAMLLCSILRCDVSKGERPSLKEVKRMKAPGLEDLFKLMERCWNENPKHRPNSTECAAVTEGLYEKYKKGINDAVRQVQTELDGAAFLKKLQRDAFELTLDPNTAHRQLSLSENKRKVTLLREDQKYTDHPDRFKVYPQVMCIESLTGRCYWEVEWSGQIEIALTYRGMNRQGHDSSFGWNDKSWSLECNGVHNWHNVYHNKEGTRLPVSPSSGSGRVAVYVNYPAGTVSFYTVSSDTHTHLHTFQSTFTEPLYAGFFVWPDSSVCVCQREGVQ